MQICAKKLLPTLGDTRYRIRFTSGKALLPQNGINLCLIDDEGSAFLKQLSYGTHSLESIHDFSGPAMGRIVDVMIAPEDQPWFLKDVKLTVGTEDETNHREYDFAYNDIIGRRGGDLAACMKPMQRPTEEMKMQYDAEYIVLKDTMLVTTAELTAIGSLITACVSGIEKGYAFALGGSVGLIYIKLLQQGIDVVGQKGSIGSSVARLAIVSILVAAILSKYNEQIHSDHVLFVMGLVGFTMYRIAVLNTYINAKSPEIKEDKENMREK